MLENSSLSNVCLQVFTFFSRYFLERGASVDAIGGELNATPLHWATRQGHLGAVVLLLKAGADPSLRDAEGCSCIHLASQFGHTALVAYFIARAVPADLQVSVNLLFDEPSFTMINFYFRIVVE